MNFDQTVLQIDLDVLEHNITNLRQKAGTRLLAVAKSDAYGLGAVPITRFLEGKCDFFGVATLSEALQLRAAGITTPILVLGRMPIEGFPYAIREDIRPVIFSREDGLALSEEAQKQDKTAPFHFAVDTGMSRIGFQVCETDVDLCAAIAALPGLFAEGLFSHFATADCEDLSRSYAQQRLFAEFDAMLQRRGLRIPLRHLNNSAGIMNFPGCYDMARTGITLYGMYPSDEVDTDLVSIAPVARWTTRVTFLKTLPAGREISYGGTFTTTRDTVIATIPVGYPDGYRRSLSGKFHVLIRGQKAPILGRICMDQMMVDVTHIPGVTVNDKVVLVGKYGPEEITMEQIAAAAGSFNYEFVSGISRRVPRIYTSGGKTIHTVHYLTDSFF